MQRWAFDGEFLGVPGALVPRGRSILYCRERPVGGPTVHSRALSVCTDEG